MNNKQIVLISSEFPPGPGGIGNQSYHLALIFHTCQYSVTVISDEDPRFPEQTYSHDAKLDFSVIRIKRHRFLPLTYLKRIAKSFVFLRKNRDAYVLCSGKFSLWLGALISLFYRDIKITAIIHGSEVSLRSCFARNLTHSALKRFPRIISVSKHSASFLSLKAHQKLKIIPNGINSEYLNEIKSDTEMQIHGDPRFLTVGNVSRRKGQLYFIRALPEIIKIFPDSMYYCAGLPKEKEAFLAEASSLNVQDHVFFTGRVSEEELIYLYKNCNIFIMLSKTQKSGDTEGFGIAILEANHFGKAAIGSFSTGIEDAIENGVSGYLVDPDNPQEIRDAVKKILNNPKAFEIQAEAHAQRHDWKFIIKSYIDFISEK